ncbi:MAG TPA: alpha-1,2-fucosyltransferase [Bacteroidales bacterium]|nr:alpha-1,2-fucosyltransferase [Bacteroidales bacterium]
MIIVQGIGGLGNQLFKYASAKRFAKELNTEVKFDLTHYKEKNLVHTFKLNRFETRFEIANEEEISEFKNKEPHSYMQRIFSKIPLKANPYCKYSYISENNHTAREIIEKISRNNKSQSYYLHGWFANPLYFEGIRAELLNEITPLKSDDYPVNYTKLLDKIQHSDSVAIHLRFGDYLTIDFFHNLGEEYYLAGIDAIKAKVQKPVFFIFTDDRPRSEGFLKHLDIKTTYTDIGPDYDFLDLYLMSRCRHIIMANSTFSWWGAWLNNTDDKIVIAPKIWYNDKKAQKKYENGDLITSDWIKI